MKLPRWWPTAVIIVGGVLVWHVYGCEQQSVGALKQQIKARETTIAVLAKEKTRVDTIAGRAKVVYVQQRARYDSLSKALPDTFFLPPPILEVLISADSTVKACSVALESCEHQVAVRDTIIWEKDSLIADLKKRKPFLIRIGKPLIPFAAGIIAGSIFHR